MRAEADTVNSEALQVAEYRKPSRVVHAMEVNNLPALTNNEDNI